MASEEARPVETDPVRAALSLRESGDLSAAIRHLYAALAENLNDPHLYVTLATMLAENEEFDRAERIFQRAFDAGVDDPGLRLNYAVFQASSGRPGNHVTVLRGLGANVVHTLSRLSLDDPSSPFTEQIRHFALADCNLARLRLKQGNLDAARDLAEKWLVFPRVWESAHDTVVSCIAPGEEAEEFQALHAESRASPAMIAWLSEQVNLVEPQLVVRLAGSAAAYLPWNWVQDLDGFDELLWKAIGQVRGEDGEIPQDLRGDWERSVALVLGDA